ncbi:MAG: hypothetical protein ACOX52_00455 [Verrucomicrobiota bacterium]
MQTLQIIVEIEIEIEIEIGIDPCPPWHPAFKDRSNWTAELCQDRLNTVAVPGFSCLKPITRPFDSETDSAPAPGSADPGSADPGSADVPVGSNSTSTPLPTPTIPPKNGPTVAPPPPIPPCHS